MIEKPDLSTFEEWLHSPCTLYFEYILSKERGNLVEFLSSQGTLRNDPGEMAIVTSVLLGNIETIEKIQKLEDFLDIYDKED